MSAVGDCPHCGVSMKDHACPTRSGTVPGVVIMDERTGTKKVARARSTKPICPQCNAVHSNERGRAVTCLWYGAAIKGGWHPHDITAEHFRQVARAIDEGVIGTARAHIGGDIPGHPLSPWTPADLESLIPKTMTVKPTERYVSDYIETTRRIEVEITKEKPKPKLTLVTEPTESVVEKKIKDLRRQKGRFR